MKVAVNHCYGGFSVTKQVYDELGIEWDGYGYINLERSDPKLIEAIEKVGAKLSSGRCAKIEIVEIPDDVKYFIDEYDGYESIHEEHRSW